MDRVKSRLTEIGERMIGDIAELREMVKQLKRLEADTENPLRRANISKAATRIDAARERLENEVNAMNDIATLSENWRDVAASNGVTLPKDDG